MCGGVSFIEYGEDRKIFFPMQNAVLPVLLKSGEIGLYTWGRRREECNQTFPFGGWARHESIKQGIWEKYHPVPVKIPVQKFMEKDDLGVSHWFDLQAGEFIQGLLANIGDKQRVYVVTVHPEDEHAVHERWPRILSKSF